MSNLMGQGTEKSDGSEVGKPPRANGVSNGYDHKARYGDDAKWPNVVWITIGILCVCGLAVLLFIR